MLLNTTNVFQYVGAYGEHGIYLVQRVRELAICATN